MMKKHVAISIVLSVLLVSCGGGGGDVACDQDYWDGTYGTCLPEGWVVLDKETLRQRGVPDETIAAFRAEESVSGQFPSITVTREALTREMEPGDYSDASIRGISVLPGYALIDSEDIKIDDEKVALHTFSAQPIETEPARRFYQVSTVHEGIGYTVTAATAMFIEKDLEASIKLILEQSTFMEQTDEKK